MQKVYLPVIGLRYRVSSKYVSSSFKENVEKIFNSLNKVIFEKSYSKIIMLFYRESIVKIFILIYQNKNILLTVQIIKIFRHKNIFN